MEEVPDCGPLIRVPGGWWIREPTECARGHKYGPNLVTRGWQGCYCPGTPHSGHHTWYCWTRVDGKPCGDLRRCGVSQDR